MIWLSVVWLARGSSAAASPRASRGQRQVDRPILQGGVALDGGDRPFQLAGVGVHLAGDVVDDLVGHRHAAQLRLGTQDRHARLVLRLGHVGDQAPLEPAEQAFFEVRDFVRRGIAGEHDLPGGLVQVVEGVEELFLRALAVAQEVDVVDDEDVHVAVAVAELVHLAVLHALDETGS